MRRCLFVALAGLVLALPGLALLCGCGAPGTDSSAEAKAAIVDQLYTLYPNQVFVEQMTLELEAYGFRVDVWRGDAVTVDFYRKLPTYGYKLIIFRVHSGLQVEADEANRTWLFTSETYSETSHVIEQLTDQLTFARTHEDAPWVFAIGARFITNSMKGDFDNTVIIMMGCSAARHWDMAQAFTKKGASTYLGWNASVDLGYVGRAALEVVSNLCTEAMTVEGAIDSTMAEVGPDPNYNAFLYGYPKQSANQTIAELIR